ncbi:MAG: cupin domain-containing protein [Myxococcales bacterium]|nr:cupin domain-containing protein [Myxococcales bacterium]
MSIRDLLPLYALGALDDDEVRAVDRALATEPALRDELAALELATAELATALPGVAPSPAVRARLLAAAEPAARFERFVARFAALFDVAAARARELLGLIDQADAWAAGPEPGCALIHFTAGPSLAGADTGFVRLAPGARFAWHRHTGEEHSLVLAGHAQDSLAGALAPGDEAIAAAGSAHDFATVGDDDFVFAVRVWGVDFTAPRPG